MKLNIYSVYYWHPLMWIVNWHVLCLSYVLSPLNLTSINWNAMSLNVNEKAKKKSVSTQLFQNAMV